MPRHQKISLDSFLSLLTSVKNGKVVEVGNERFPRTANGRKYAPVFEKAMQVFYTKFIGNKARTNLPVVKIPGASFSLEYVPRHKCVRIATKNGKRPELAEAWLDFSGNYDVILRFKLANNNPGYAYLLWPESTDPTKDD